MKVCHRCHAPWQDPGQPGFNNTCGQCGIPLHSCGNCTYFVRSGQIRCTIPAGRARARLAGGQSLPPLRVPAGLDCGRAGRSCRARPGRVRQGPLEPAVQQGRDAFPNRSARSRSRPVAYDGGRTVACSARPIASRDRAVAHVRARTGQCNLAVSTEFANPELSAPPHRFVVFDDGSGNALYACGSFTEAGGQSAKGLARWDGISWSVLPPPPSQPSASARWWRSTMGPVPRSTRRSRCLFLPSSRRFNDGTARPGAAAAQPVPIVTAFQVFDPGSGPMLLASSFNGWISVWTGTGWPLFASAAGHISAMRTWNDGSGPALYVAGHFTSIGGVAATGVARFDGVAWPPVGGPVTGPAVSDELGGNGARRLDDDGTGPALYLAGGFTAVAGVPAVGIARWNGMSWSSVGAGLGEPRSSLFASG